MKTMKIFEPAMCCPTGLCGVGVDPELLRVSTALNTLKQHGVEVQRYNLTSAPGEFVKSEAVTEYLRKFGPDRLPVTLVDDFIVIAGRYPTNEEFASWLELPADVLGGSCCCGGDTSACCTDDCCADGNKPEGCCTDSPEGCCTDDCCADGDKPEGCCTNGCC